MKRKNGFTLLELLIAAAIIGTLAIFATQSFRNTSSEIRKEDALARARMVATAARRFILDHPNATIKDAENVVLSARDRDQCNNGISLQNLINCGYLDYRQYESDTREGDTYKQNFRMIISKPEARTLKVCAVAVSKKILHCKDGGCCVEETF